MKLKLLKLCVFCIIISSIMSQNTSSVDESIDQDIGREWPLPPYKLTFKSKHNELVQNRRDQWNRDIFEYSAMPIGEFNNVIKGNSEWAASLFPLCKNEKRLENIYKLILSTGVLSDQTRDVGAVGEIRESDQFKRLYDKCNAHVNQVSDLMKLPFTKECISLTGKKPYNLFYYSTVLGIFKDLPIVQQNRLTKSCKQNAMLCLKKLEKFNYTVELGIWIIDNSKNYFKSLDDLLEVKHKTEVVSTIIELIEYAYDLHLSEEEWEKDRRMAQVTRWTGDLINLANDIGTFEQVYKEANKRADRVFNAIGVIMVIDKCDEEQAMDKVVKYFSDLEVKTKKLMDEMKTDSSVTKKQKEMIKHLQYQIGASYWGNRNMK